MILLFFGLMAWADSTPPAIQRIFDEMAGSNREIEFSQLNYSFNVEGLRGARSRLWPTLNLSLAATQQSEPEQSSPDAPASGGESAPDNSLPPSSTPALSTDITTDKGWTGQLSSSYFIFTKYAIRQEIERSENSVKAAALNQSLALDSKKSQLLQLLLEWQFLADAEPAVSEATNLIEKVTARAKNKSAFLYTEDDRADLSEKNAQLNFQAVQVKEGFLLVQSAIETLVPGLNNSRLKDLPKIAIEYQMPDYKSFETLYRQASRSHQIAELDLASARAYNKSAEWDRPWIPVVYTSASYSQNGDFKTTRDSSSISLIAAFNVFDGFYTSARRQQSRVSVKMAEIRREVELDKRILYMKNQAMKSKVAQAEYKLKAAKTRKKELSFNDVRRKHKQGLTTTLEVSASTLEFLGTKMDALKSLKDYQQAILDIAVELNQMDKVRIYETNRN